jgi:hypothetical protein
MLRLRLGIDLRQVGKLLLTRYPDISCFSWVCYDAARFLF